MKHINKFFIETQFYKKEMKRNKKSLMKYKDELKSEEMNKKIREEF